MGAFSVDKVGLLELGATRFLCSVDVVCHAWILHQHFFSVCEAACDTLEFDAFGCAHVHGQLMLHILMNAVWNAECLSENSNPVSQSDRWAAILLFRCSYRRLSAWSMRVATCSFVPSAFLISTLLAYIGTAEMCRSGCD